MSTETDQKTTEMIDISKLPLAIKDSPKKLIIPTSIHIEAIIQINLPETEIINKYRDKTTPKVPVSCLVDTGCMLTTISSNFYEKLNPYHKELELFNKTSMTLRNCHGGNNELKGTINLRLYLQEDDFYEVNALISDKLSHDFILGYNFLGDEKIVRNISSQHITLVKRDKKQRHRRVKIVRKTQDPIACYAIRNNVIEPNQMHWLICELRNNEKANISDFKFTLGDSLVNDIDLLPIIYESYKGQPCFLIPTMNNSGNPIEIEAGTKITEVEIIEGEIGHLDLTTMSFYFPEKSFKGESIQNDQNLKNDQNKKIIENNNTFLNAEKELKSQTALNKQEKIDQWNQFNDKGYFQPSVTDYIKSKSSLTDLALEIDKIGTQKEFFDQFDLENLSPHYKEKAKKIFWKNLKAFALHKYDIGKTNLIEMKIEVTNEDPKIQKFIPLPQGSRDQVKEILDQLERYDIIRKCNEPSNYCSNILVIKKRDGKSIRLLFDGRLLNYDTKRLPMATTSKLEVLNHLVHKKHLTSMDLADSFFHIPLDKDSQPLTAFYSAVHSQRFCFKRAPQGLRNSPLYLKLLLDKIFSDMSDSCILFFDDLLIATNDSLDHHLKIVDKVLQKLIAAGLKLRPNKVNLAKKEVQFLGMIFDKEKLSIPDAKLEAFKKLPSPTTPKKAKSLICALSYYRNFVPKFAELSREILELGNIHNKSFKWTTDLETKLRTLINEVCKNSKLYLPDPDKRFYVQTDSSTNCGAGRIFQKDEQGNELLIAAVSRVYSKTERAYSIFKKEILALLYSLKSMDYFLRFAKQVTILVDAKSIIYLRLAKDSSGILLRFSLELSKYDAIIEHVSGEDNQISDMLSRHNEGIDEIIQENLRNQPISEKQSVDFVKRLTLPKELKLNEEELKILLKGPSPTFKTKLAPKKTKAIIGERHIKNTPATLTNKKLNLPQLSFRRPGVILKEKFNKNKNNNYNNKCYCCTFIENNALTRSKSKQNNEENKEPKQPSTSKIDNPYAKKYNNEKSENKTQEKTFLPNTRNSHRKRTIQDREKSNENDTTPQQSTSKQPSEQPKIISQEKQENNKAIKEKEEIIKKRKIIKGNETYDANQTPGTSYDANKKGIKRKSLHEENDANNSKNNEENENLIENFNETHKIKRSKITIQDEFCPENEEEILPANNHENLSTKNKENFSTENKEKSDTNISPTTKNKAEKENQQTENETQEKIEKKTISYVDVNNLTNYINDGILSLEQFITAQQQDNFCLSILEKARTKSFEKLGYEIIDGIIFRKFGNIKRPVLPEILTEVIFNIKHFSIFGAHASSARIAREIQEHFYTPRQFLYEKLKALTKSCYICQLYENEIKSHTLKELPRPTRPRISWSMDIITNLPTSENGYNQILLFADNFSTFLVCAPLKDSTSNSIIDAITSHIFSPFGIPKIIRSDEQASFYNSNEFYKFFKTFNIKLEATSVAAPFSNARAESSIKNIKKLARKFFYQEKCIHQWDKFLPLLTMSHNSSIGVYGHSSESLMFGYKNQNDQTQLLNFDWQKEDDEKDYADRIFEIAKAIRDKAIKRTMKVCDKNRTFKNMKRILKKFRPGSLVFHRQLQVSTGASSSFKPKFTGPYIITSLNNDNCTAYAEHIKSGAIIKAHFSNLQLLHFNPQRMPYKKGMLSNITERISEIKQKTNKKKA